ncbi:MAG TPA: tetratricopeptide repeat protein [Planctomycetota bacterium]|nr:tetratricopeptide repeat protein [Planctomycetota bacterium]
MPHLKKLLTQRLSKEYLLALGIQLSDNEEFAFAEEVLKLLCRQEPRHHLPPFNLGIVYARSGKFSEALEQFELALKHTPDFAPAHQQIASAFKSMNELTEAREWYAKYLALRPDDAHEWINKAIVESDLGEYKAATVSYESAQRADAENESLYFNWALTAERQQDRERIAFCAQRLAALVPDDWRTHFVAAWNANAQGQTFQAWERVVEAFECAPEESRAYCAGMALHFANEHGLRKYAESLLPVIFEEQCFDEMVLFELRCLSGAKSNIANAYRITLEGVMSEEESSELSRLEDSKTKYEDPAFPARYAFYRHLIVFAENEQQARNFALEFEKRCMEEISRIESVEVNAVSDGTDVHLGVSWRSGKLIFPIDVDGDQHAEA